jgi:hypothetical protein
MGERGWYSKKWKLWWWGYNLVINFWGWKMRKMMKMEVGFEWMDCVYKEKWWYWVFVFSCRRNLGIDFVICEG